VQESLTNVIRHSGARRAAVTARLHDGRLELVISDDGHGRAASGTATSGAGLIGMQERTTMLGGEFCAGNGDRGFVVHAVLPARLDR
jgi:signal transduction histidine kinase